MSKPVYQGEHERVRRALVAVYNPGVTPCAIGGEPLSGPPSRLDLAHKTDELGRRTGGWLGLACRRHNRSANSWNKLGRKAAADPRTPGEVAERDERAARRERRRYRREFEAAQEPGKPETGREW